MCTTVGRVATRTMAGVGRRCRHRQHRLRCRVPSLWRCPVLSHRYFACLAAGSCTSTTRRLPSVMTFGKQQWSARSAALEVHAAHCGSPSVFSSFCSFLFRSLSPPWQRGWPWDPALAAMVLLGFCTLFAPPERCLRVEERLRVLCMCVCVVLDTFTTSYSLVCFLAARSFSRNSAMLL